MTPWLKLFVLFFSLLTWQFWLSFLRDFTPDFWGAGVFLLYSALPLPWAVLIPWGAGLFRDTVVGLPWGSYALPYAFWGVVKSLKEEEEKEEGVGEFSLFFFFSHALALWQTHGHLFCQKVGTAFATSLLVWHTLRLFPLKDYLGWKKEERVEEETIREKLVFHFTLKRAARGLLAQEAPLAEKCLERSESPLQSSAD